MEHLRADKEKLDKLDLSLKRLDRWVKVIAIFSGIFGLLLTGLSIWNLFTQRELSQTQHKLLQHQVVDAEEKQRLNIRVELDTSPAAGNAVNIAMKISNHSVRTVEIAMVGVRIWKRNWTSADDNFQKHPELLIYSASKVVGCPSNICPRESAKSRLLNTDHRLILTPNPNAPAIESFGTIPISRNDLNAGVWIQGIAWTVEGLKGECAVAGPPRFEGSFPVFCERAAKDNPNCAREAQCVYEETAKAYPDAKRN